MRLKIIKIVFKYYHNTQCAEEKSNESVEDMEGTFDGW